MFVFRLKRNNILNGQWSFTKEWCARKDRISQCHCAIAGIPPRQYQRSDSIGNRQTGTFILEQLELPTEESCVRWSFLVCEVFHTLRLLSPDFIASSPARKHCGRMVSYPDMTYI